MCNVPIWSEVVFIYKVNNYFVKYGKMISYYVHKLSHYYENMLGVFFVIVLFTSFV